MTAPAFPAPRARPVHPDDLWREIVYIAYHLHWSLDSILNLDHPTRARIIAEIAHLTAPVPLPAPDFGPEGAVPVDGSVDGEFAYGAD